MIKQLLNFLFSTRLMAILFVLLAVSMGVGTFIESIYDTSTARYWVYNAHWFEVAIVLFALNFVGNIPRYRLLRREKWSILLLHLSFILIISGAFVTRYISFEGIMPIREGETSNHFLSDKTYVTAYIDGTINGEPRRKELQQSVMFSKHLKNELKWKTDFDNQPFSLKLKTFMPFAKEGVVADNKSPDTFLKLVESEGGQRHEKYLQEGKAIAIHNIIFSLNNSLEGAVNIDTSHTPYTINTPFEGTYMRMADRYKGELKKGETQPLQLRALYTVAGLQFVFPEGSLRGRQDLIKSSKTDPEAQEGLVFEIEVNKERKTISILGGKGHSNPMKTLSVGGLDVHLSYGSMYYELPFSITLRDFVAGKHPGTESSYSSFMSRVKIQDNPAFNYDIYMNHILDHKGYRFFQASFDPDEKGTILSVNHDFWGTLITYTGYGLLYLGLMGILFYGKSRFKKLSATLSQLKQTPLTILLVVATSTWAFSQHTNHREPNKSQIDSLIQSTKVSDGHATKFGSLVIQDANGRMKPVNTFSSELLRKISKGNTYKGFSSDQVFLSMIQNPMVWYYEALIYVKPNNDSIRRLIGINENQKYARLIDFFDANGTYKLGPYLQKAYATNTPNQFQKDFKETDMRLGLLSRTLSGELLALFPIPADANKKWISPLDQENISLKIKDPLYANFIHSVLPYYVQLLKEAIRSKDYTKADELVGALKKNQQNYGGAVMPSEKQIKVEMLYNSYDIFKKLFSWYLYVGLILLAVLIVEIFRKRVWTKIASIALRYAIYACFALHLIGLAARWYVSGHAPWSDAYESMIYVAFATMCMGVLFSRKSLLTLASTAFVTSIILMVAHWNWLDPNINNLQPVLDSYWLMIHVAVIVASYGPFTLSAILGVIVLILIISSNRRTKGRIEPVMQELTIVNELSLTVGLIMLTIGNFLGGQWANESWGRYWGWDPKETWALVSIMVYAFLLHMRLIPKLRGLLAINIASVVAYGSIIMTYFGVNFYLVGLHSYASGERIITPVGVYYAVLFIVLLALLAHWRYKKLYISKQ